MKTKKTNEEKAAKQAAYEQCAEPIPMDDSIPTPLTDAVVADVYRQGFDLTTIAAHGMNLERQLTISRRSCAALQRELVAVMEAADTIAADAARIVEAAMSDIRELNERLAERTRAYEEKDRKAMKLLSRSCHEHWKTNIVATRMKALLEDIAAAGRPHSSVCDCRWPKCQRCEAWSAAVAFLTSGASPRPADGAAAPDAPSPAAGPD